MGTTAVPAIQFTTAGLVLPTDAAILAGAQTDIDTAFGGGVNPDLKTPQGQLATSETAIISDKNAQIALIVNQVDPQYSTGRWQDAIAEIYFLDRKPATSTIVTCTLVGLGPTVVPAGTLAQDTSGNTYQLISTVTIPSGGTLTGTQWQNIVTGPIACPAGTLIKIYQQIPGGGLDTINNPADGILGQLVESPQEFEFRRSNSVALNGRGTTQAIYANVFNVANVLDCYVIDNPAGVVIPNGSTNYPMPPHSVFVAVIGGDPVAICTAIWNKKDGGCNYAPAPVGQPQIPGNGTVVVEDIEDNVNYSFPYPTYPVAFLTPGTTPVLFAVQIVNVPGLPSNIVTLVQNAIIAQFNGTNGSIRARIGSLILATSFYAPVALAAPNVLVLSILLGLSSATLTSVQMGIDQAPSISAGNISVTLV